MIFLISRHRPKTIAYGCLCLKSDMKSARFTKQLQVKEFNTGRHALDEQKNKTSKASFPKSKNHIYENINAIKNLKNPGRPIIVQDTINGHRQDVEKSGLKLKYVFKKEYGQIPMYIRQRQQKREEKTEVVEDSAIRLVNDCEKQEVLQGLKNNLRLVEKKLLSLPLIIDTISIQKYKNELEDRLVQLQQDINVLESNDVYITSE